MDPRLWGVAVPLLATIVLSGTAFGQVKPDAVVKRKSCSGTHKSVRRIVSNNDIVEFSVPLFAKIKKIADVDYVEYYVRSGPEQDKMWLRFMLGPTLGEHPPDDLGNTLIQWKAQEWGCFQHEDGTDWRGIGPDGHRWRHMIFPFGFATYKDTPPKAANYFDRILDSMCCGECPNCKRLPCGRRRQVSWQEPDCQHARQARQIFVDGDLAPSSSEHSAHRL